MRKITYHNIISPLIINGYGEAGKKSKHNKKVSSPIDVESSINYNLLHDENVFNNVLGEKVIIGTTKENRPKSCNATRVYVNQNPERDILYNRSNINSKHNDIIKAVIVSDSITKGIDMVKFNNELSDVTALKRVFPGATASQINHFVKASLAEDKPKTIIICAGTNNITKKQQSPEDTAKEITEIVQTCSRRGVKTIYVSLICRPSHQKEINEINKLLRYYSGIYNFTLIDNEGIKEEDLWKDKVHLNNKGIYSLACNYISHLNRPPLSSFENIWN